jgi:hypothetical protein
MCSVSIVSLLLSLPLSYLSLLLPPTLLCIRFSFRVQFPSFLDFRFQYQRCFGRHCFQFITLASIILPYSRSCRLRSQSFVCSLFHLVSLTRHHYNMSPIMTFLVSGLPTFLFRRHCVAFYSGVSSHVPCTIHGLMFFCPRRPSWLLPPRGFEDPRKTSIPSRRTS